MKAWVLYNIGDLRYTDIPAPVLKPGQTLVKVKCAGICSSDLPRIYETGAYHYPLIPGHEFSGIVASVYDNQRDAHWIGKRVGAFPLIPCRKCPPCLRGEFETCRDYGYTGSRQDGAFAEYVAVPAENLIELPESVSLEQAAMLEPAAVALHAVRLAESVSGKSAAVIGTGAIGRLIAKWLTIFGACNVKLVGRDDTPPEDADICFEAVGSNDALQCCLKTVRPGGRLILVGNPTSDFNLPRGDYWQILRKQITVRGSWNSSFPADWQTTLDTIAGGSLKPDELISHRYEHRELDCALKMMLARAERRLKVMLEYP